MLRGLALSLILFVSTAAAQDRTPEQRIADLEAMVTKLVQTNNEQNKLLQAHDTRLAQLTQTNNEQSKLLQGHSDSLIRHDNVLKYLHVSISPARIIGISHWCAGNNVHACGFAICREAHFPSGKALTWIPGTNGNTVTSAICEPPRM
jgi:hypothetical protein